MAVVKNVSHKGNDSVSTLGGHVRLEEGQGRLVAYDGSNNLGLFGFDDAGKVVVKVAKEGFDANSASDDNLIFNSNQNIFKINTTGTVSINADTLNTAKAAVIEHSLPQPPFVLVYVTTPFLGPNTLSLVPYYQFGNTNYGYDVAALIWVDNTYVHFQVDLVRGVGNLGVYTFRYYILQESAT